MGQGLVSLKNAMVGSGHSEASSGRDGVARGAWHTGWARKSGDVGDGYGESRVWVCGKVCIRMSIYTKNKPTHKPRSQYQV